VYDQKITVAKSNLDDSFF